MVSQVQDNVIKPKTHIRKVNEKLNKSETTVNHDVAEEKPANDFSLVIPLSLDQTPTFVEQQNLVQTKFNIDEDLINLADNNTFLDDNNVQLIIVNEANQDAAVMLMTSNEVKLSDAASEDNLI